MLHDRKQSSFFVVALAFLCIQHNIEKQPEDFILWLFFNAVFQMKDTIDLWG
jgi:hypothetical protein